MNEVRINPTTVVELKFTHVTLHFHYGMMVGHAKCHKIWNVRPNVCLY